MSYGVCLIRWSNNEENKLFTASVRLLRVAALQQLLLPFTRKKGLHYSSATVHLASDYQ